jgi:hypothetical protein
MNQQSDPIPWEEDDHPPSALFLYSGIHTPEAEIMVTDDANDESFAGTDDTAGDAAEEEVLCP